MGVTVTQSVPRGLIVNYQSIMNKEIVKACAFLHNRETLF